jgi:hypothetical protein
MQLMKPVLGWPALGHEVQTPLLQSYPVAQSLDHALYDVQLAPAPAMAVH